MDRVIFCVFSAKDEEVYNDVVPRFFPPTEQDLAALREEEEAAKSSLTGETTQQTG
jgi:hypothetical protein